MSEIDPRTAKRLHDDEGVHPRPPEDDEAYRPVAVDEELELWRIIAQVPADAYAGIKSAIGDAGGTLVAGYRNDGRDEETDASRDPEERNRRLLELNGFNAVRSEAINALNALVSIPVEALDACLAFNERMVVGLRLQDGAQAREALRIAERHSEYLRAIRRLRRDLETLEDRIEARERITAR